MHLYVIVSGSRYWTQRHVIEHDLDVRHQRYDFMCVLEGGAKGADRIAGQWAARMRYHAKAVGWLRVPADWTQHGTKAGPIRNGQMLTYLKQAAKLGHQVGVLAYPLPGGKGTAGMIKAARNAGIPTIVR